ncbi:MAG: MFS transporter, partial [Verrucomicrobia bacterium]|nr:MFS transporter [Verrucomicrobiota bacterium]
DYTPLWIALLLLHMIFAAFLLYIFVLRWMEKTHPFLPVLLSTLCFAISSFYSAYFNAEINFGRIALARVLAGFGLAFFFFPLIKIALDSVPLEKKAQGMSIIQSFRVLSSSFGIAFYSTLWIRRKVFYNDRLGSSLTETSELTNSFLAKLSLFGQKGLAAKELLNEGLSKQATALGLGDCFYFMGWLITGLFIAIFLFSFKSLISYYKERLLVQKRKKQGTT